MNTADILLAFVIIALVAVVAWAVAKKHRAPGEDGPERTAGPEISDDERRAYDRAVMDEMTWRDAQ